MLTFYLWSQSLLSDAVKRLKAPPTDERGLSETVQTALLVAFAIVAVGILIAAVTILLNNKAALIAGA